MLYDPQEELPPSSVDTIKYFQKFAERHSVEVELLTKRQLAELAEFDGLFIRATTSIDDYTYRFARRAVQEGMPVIDDPRLDDPLHQQGLSPRTDGGARRAGARRP